MAAPTYDAMLKKELEENKELTNEQRLEIFRRLGNLTDKKLTIRLAKIRGGVAVVKYKTRQPRERFERPAEPVVPLGQLIDKLIEETQSVQSSQGQEIGNNSGSGQQSGN